MTSDLLSDQEIAERALDLLPIRRPWSIDRFIAEISIDRQRPISIHELPESLSGEISGMWFPTARADLIYIRTDAEGEYREHIICHELAHIVLAHHADVDTVPVAEYLQRQMPDLGAGMLSYLQPLAPCLTRTNFVSPVERQAEWLATLILARASELRKPLIPEHIQGPRREMLLRAAATFGWQR